MAFPVFAVGELVTSADQNRIGMWLVNSQTFINASTIDVTGFSSNFVFYRLAFESTRTTGGNTALNGQFMLGGTLRNTTYFAASFFVNFTGGNGTLTSTNNGSSFLFGHADSGGSNIGMWDINNMTTSKACAIGTYWDTGSARLIQASGFHNTAVTNDTLRVTVISGQITGNFKLYGYRN